MTFDPNNCYICYKSPGITAIKTVLLTGYSETPIYKILEYMIDVKLKKKEAENYLICQECFLSINKYDNLHQQAEQIQNHLSSIFADARIEKVFIKSEPIELETIQLAANYSSLRISCKQCQLEFANMNDMMSHSNTFHSSSVAQNPEPKKLKRKTINKSGLEVSRSFKQMMLKDGIEYSYQMFQDAFFSNSEKNSYTMSTKSESQSRKSEYDEDSDNFESTKLDDIGTEFKKLAESEGVKYDLLQFRKTFVSKNPVRSFQNQKKAPAKKAKISSDNKTVNASFAAELRSNGFKYDLETFQKAFSFLDPKSLGNLHDEEVKKLQEIEDFGQTSCPNCSKNFIQKWKFLNHLKCHRATNPENYCFECKRQFSSLEGLQVHRSIAHEDKTGSFHCQECEEEFSDLLSFRTHQNSTTHENKIGPFKCQECNKMFPDRSGLRSHLYVHQKDEYLCVICGKTFKNRKNFKTHLTSHEEIRKFTCSFDGCGKQFRTLTKQKIHERVHTGVKLYECPFCPGRKFAQKWGMDLHIKKHHHNEPRNDLICPFCGLSVQSKLKLERHLAKYHQVVRDEN